ncbi:DUF3515 domain-containing protein [Micromonospora sp. HM5-17]|jgi:hypothetical protein|uniref:DUF3515 domain-containing protein n=1 Tax=Micromonospora sp. HM5-17 TaxID=2487710 RepID=UPI000F47701C|nr:DUF3515 domain-containing protein [Micromonospora sp. HM5-17]ROT32697.1 DUF3515 domain-containing protein [Micromonospora sp. HM5-17]
MTRVTGADRTDTEAAENRTDPPGSTPRGDRTTRQAALWATVIALPLTLLVGILAATSLAPDPAVDKPTPSPTTAARPQSTAPVEMAAPVLAERPATLCRALLSQLPATLRGLAQRPVTAGPEQNAAYGDPAVTLACGVPAPTFAPEAELWVVNGVCWLPEQRSDGLLLTTVDRAAAIRLSIPAAQSPTLEWAAPVAESIVAAVPSVKNPPSGCLS